MVKQRKIEQIPRHDRFVGSVYILHLHLHLALCSHQSKLNLPCNTAIFPGALHHITFVARILKLCSSHEAICQICVPILVHIPRTSLDWHANEAGESRCGPGEKQGQRVAEGTRDSPVGDTRWEITEVSLEFKWWSRVEYDLYYSILSILFYVCRCLFVPCATLCNSANTKGIDSTVVVLTCSMWMQKVVEYVNG